MSSNTTIERAVPLLKVVRKSALLGKVILNGFSVDNFSHKELLISYQHVSNCREEMTVFLCDWLLSWSTESCLDCCKNAKLKPAKEILMYVFFSTVKIAE